MVFALLSLSTAKANYNLSEKSVKAVSNYYAADTKAEEIYSQIRAGNMPDGVKQKGNTYTYTCAIDDKQKLLVEIKKQKEKFHVVKWEKQYTGEWTIPSMFGMEWNKCFQTKEREKRYGTFSGNIKKSGL